MAQRDPGPIPNRWLKCPRKASGLVAELFLPFKTPLGPKFNGKVPEESLFTPSMLFANMKSLKVKLGLWIDLTNTSRYYDKQDVEKNDCKYIKLQCRGHGETPSEEQTKLFIEIVQKFASQKPLERVGIHCTHGFNRTGFLIISYMVEVFDYSVGAAFHEFKRIRPPGIYKQDYIQELFNRYNNDEDDVPLAPMLPDWCYEDGEVGEYDDDDENEDQQYEEDNDAQNSSTSSDKKHKEKGRAKRTVKKTSFIPGVIGVDPYDEEDLHALQKLVQNMCNWKSGFPGSQPVSMDVTNLLKLHEKPYRVSWKADGTRYMMLIKDENRVFMIDRDFCFFIVHGLKFVTRDLQGHLKDTLLDGEMVTDKANGEVKTRYLCYDVIRCNGKDVGKQDFDPIRLKCIQNDIVNPRIEAMKKGIIKQNSEPFSVRLKPFWELPMAEKLLGEKFAKTLSHEPDGLIFQPAKEPYVPGTSEDVLKWKPIELNSVDFKLKIARQEGEGMLPTKRGYLYVGQLSNPFDSIPHTKAIKDMHNKIIECMYDKVKRQWVFMRERTDKSFPNSLKTAQAVCESIQNPVTKEKLLAYIHHSRFHDDSDLMPPPSKIRR